VLLVASARGLAGVWFDAQQHHPGTVALPEQPDHPWLKAGAAALAAYFQAADGATTALDQALWDGLEFDTAGTPFQQAVWQALRRIPAGQLSSYGAIAQALGRPAAVRAVGLAVGRNPVAIAIPCHRVVGHDGSLTGYAGGLDRKQALLRHEGLHLLGPADVPRRQRAVGAAGRGPGRAAPNAQADLFGEPGATTVGAR
jgi:methylated-DNA-[protein]-cysteine S-methyltransferase